MSVSSKAVPCRELHPALHQAKQATSRARQILLPPSSVWSQPSLEGRAAGGQVEEERRKAEADKVAAITALERASREFMREKAEKRALEARIAGMQKQVLVGGARLEDSPAVRCAALLLAACCCCCCLSGHDQWRLFLPRGCRCSLDPRGLACR